MKYLFSLFITIVVFIFSTSSCVPVAGTGSSSNGSSAPRVYYPDLKFINTTYQESIRTVQLVHFQNGQLVSTNNPVIPLGKNDRLVLSFDDINEQQQQYQAKIIHCNKDWSALSNIQAMDYLNEFNQYPIRDFEFSFDTKLGYIHYTFDLPSVKISGNYLIVVYKNNNDKDIILSERFMVHENLADISYNIIPSSLVKQRRTYQELEFEVMLNRIDVINTATDIYPIVRQNNNWLFAEKAPKPMQILDGNNRLIYKFYNGELNFPGNNEFRFIDISTVNFKGNNVVNINKETMPISVLAGIDGSRASQAYREWEDRNGTFVIGNRERQTDELVSDYFLTTFQLKHPSIDESIHIVGEFNNWEITNDSRMKYNANLGIYQNNILMKQGYYEYMYYVQGNEISPIDGSYMETDNTYDIIIYFNNPQLRYDRLIGYTRFNSRVAQ